MDNHNEKLEECLARIRELVAKTVEESKAQEDAERAAGKVLVDNPVARQMVPSWSELRKERWEGCKKIGIFLLEGHLRSFTTLVFGTTTYLQSRRQWKAYRPAVEILREAGFSDEEPLYGIFHYVPGVMVFATNENRILVCVRSKQLAGTHVGMLSFPAGLMKPGETLDDAAARQLAEESGIGFLKEHADTNVAAGARNPDAPQTTYCFKWEAYDSHVRETFEAEGKTFIWVSVLNCLEPALAGDMKPMVAAFREKGIDVPDTLRIAPDALEGLKGWGFGR